MKASVIGGGSWGSAFALHLGSLNIPTKLWIREKDIYEKALRERENKTFLPGFRFPSSVSFCHHLKEAVNSSSIVFIAVPSKFCREVYKKLAPLLSSEQMIVSLTKGLEENSISRMSEVMNQEFSSFFNPRLSVISGPSFAKEVAKKYPTAVVIASKDLQMGRKIQHLVSSLDFRAYLSDDVIGVELGGSIKNVIAIASGISDGLGFGSNAKAALITRGLTEITRLGIQMGAKSETFSGLAGVGDLVLTCTGKLSRNRYVGSQLGEGKKLDEIVQRMKMVAEGISTTHCVRQLARRECVEMPITEQIYQTLYEHKDPKKALSDLMSRKLKHEYNV
ncbi:NAD(P)-dependent glycerol-3-phosphate dehydrogenase [bacterium]|nr:NAD(P)-dependent glycerol-3-phosphate dehydrogenase [bacterium]